MRNAFGQPQSVVVLGGTSDIGRAVLHSLIAQRCRSVVLAGRDSARLAQIGEECLAAGATRIGTVTFDALEISDAKRCVDECFDKAEDVDLVLVAIGALSKSGEEYDFQKSAEVAAANYAWPVAAITHAASRMNAAGHGRIVVISSVAGVRVRQANFVYGSAKAGIDAFSLGLSDALAGSGVSIQIVRPGFVRSKMTAGMKDVPFTTNPDAVASAIIKGLGSDKKIVWSPPILRWVFLLLRMLPAPLWRRLPE